VPRNEPFCDSLATQQGLDSAGSMLTNAQALETLLAAEPSRVQDDEDDYGLLEDEQVVLVRTYGDDGDDQLLAEIRPRYIVMMEPSMDFVRRIEVSVLHSREKMRADETELGVPQLESRTGGSSILYDVQQDRRRAQIPSRPATRKERVRVTYQGKGGTFSRLLSFRHY
jgi:hypothetical protein